MKNKNYILLGIGTLSLAIISFGLGVAMTNKPMPKLEDGKSLVAEIDGKKYTAEELYDELKANRGTTVLIGVIDKYIADKEVETTTTMRLSAKNQVEQLRDQYVSNGTDWTTQLSEWGFQNEAELEEYFIQESKSEEIVNNYYEELITDKQISDYYKDTTSGEITAKHILITPDVTSESTAAEKTAAEAKALETAKEVIKKYKDGEEWNDLVQEYSEDTGTKSSNGELTFTKSEVVPEFWAASDALENDKYTLEPVKSQFGYHIILKVSEGAKPSLEDAKEDIVKALVAIEVAKENAGMKAWAQIRKNYKLVIYDEDIKELYDSVLAKLK
jgi:foldase protein PrsA